MKKHGVTRGKYGHFQHFKILHPNKLFIFQLLEFTLKKGQLYTKIDEFKSC